MNETNTQVETRPPDPPKLPVHARLAINPRGGPVEAVVDRIDNVGTWDFEIHIRTLGD